MRRIRTILTVTSLLLCLLTLALGIHSLWYADSVAYAGTSGSTRIQADLTCWGFRMDIGLVRFYLSAGNTSSYPTTNDQGFRFKWEPIRPGLGPLTWFVYQRNALAFPQPKAIQKAEYLDLRFPLPLLTLATALLPAVALRRHLTTRARRRLGQCPTCGYDLRSTPTQYPECGAAPI